jgi:hypothetical protein
MVRVRSYKGWIVGCLSGANANMREVAPNRMAIEELQRAASFFLHELRGSAERAVLVGAVRRNRVASELELLALAKSAAPDLFGNSEPDLEAITGCVSQWGSVSHRSDGALVCVPASDTPAGTRSGVRVVVHVIHSASSWGLSELRLTGPTSFVTFLMQRLTTQGYVLNRSGESLRTRQGGEVAVPDEATLFELARIEPVNAEDREAPTFQAPVQTPSEWSSRSSPTRNAIEHQGRGMPIERD